MSAEYRRQSLGGGVVRGHLLTVVICLLVMLVQPAQPQRATMTSDVVFALDDSTNVQADDWSQMLNLMNQFVDRVTVAPGNVRVGVVQYSNTASISFDLNTYRTNAVLKPAISRLRQMSRSAERNLAHAFQVTLSELLMKGQRYFAAKIFVIITNGVSLDTTQTNNIAQYAKSQGWKVIGIFVGANTTTGYQEMVRISSNVQDVRDLRADNYTRLPFEVTTLVMATAVSSVSAPGNVFYGYNSALDIAFVVDGTFSPAVMATLR